MLKTNCPKAVSAGVAGWYGILTALVIAGGTVTSRAANKPAGPKYVFFPPAPDAPHIQFLTAFASEKDLRGGKDGTFLTFLTGAAPPEKPIGKPYGAAFYNNRIYVCDTAFGAVLKLDLVTHRLNAIETRGPGSLRTPLNLAIDTDGTLYVADSGRDQVVIFDSSENFMTAIGLQGEMKPRDVAVTKDHVLVADVLSQRIRVYDKTSRALLFSIPKSEDATNDEKKLFMPTNIALDSQGRVYVSDTGAWRVQVYDASGNYVRSIGRYGDNVGEFVRPKGVAVDRENRLYAVDAATQVAQIFDEQGHLLMWFGEPKASSVSLNLPAKVLVDYDHVKLFQRFAAPNFKVDYLILVVNQYGPRKVSVFGFGETK